MKKLKNVVLAFLINLSVCTVHAIPPTVVVPAAPDLSAINAIELATVHLNSIKTGEYRLYCFDVKLIEGSMYPAPKGTSRHWVVSFVNGGAPIGEKKVIEIYVSVNGDVTNDSPPSLSNGNGRTR